MWDESDFESLYEEYQDHAADYTEYSSNSLAARTLFVNTHALHQFHADLETEKGDGVTVDHHIQILCLHRGIQELRSLFWLVQHYSYTAARGRLRFLLETYMLVKDLNRNKEKTGDKFVGIVLEMNENEYGSHEPTPLTQYLSGKRRQLRGDLAAESTVYSEVYDLMSNVGSHPNSIKSMGLDGSHDASMEEDTLHMGLAFAYALAAQYRRTFEDTILKDWVEQELDSVMVQAQLIVGNMPAFLRRDLDYIPR